MKNITAILISGFLFLTLNHTLQAEDFNYNYVQLTYDDVDFTLGEGVSTLGGDGFGVAGAFEITPELFISADIKAYDLVAGVDLDIWDIGIGYHRSINTMTDLVAGLAMGKIKLPTVDLDTMSITAGVRHQLNNNIELGGQIKYIDYDGNDSDVRLGGNVLYKFKKNLSGIFALEFGDTDVMSLGARFEF